jgi:hypothetical protein
MVCSELPKDRESREGKLRLANANPRIREMIPNSATATISGQACRGLAPDFINCSN